MDEIVITICQQPFLVQLVLSDDQASVSVPKLGISLSSSHLSVNQALQWAIRSVSERIVQDINKQINRTLALYEQVDENIRKCIGGLQVGLYFTSENLPGALKHSVDYLESSATLLEEAARNMQEVETMLLLLQQISRFAESLEERENLVSVPFTRKEIRAEIDKIAGIKKRIKSVSQGIRGASVQSIPSLIKECTEIRNRWQKNRNRTKWSKIKKTKRLISTSR